MREEIIGNARLYLGDARDLIGELMGVTISDPPYGNGTVLGMGGGSKGDGGMWAGVAIPHDNDLIVRDQVLSALDQPFAIFAAINKPRPAATKITLIWDKGEHVGAGDLSLPWKPNAELIHVGGMGWSGSHRGSSILRFNAVAGCVGNRNDGKRAHPFEKPLDLMRHLVHRAPPLTIVDPFMGSGTTGVAAMMEGRPFVGVECNVDWFDAACKRIEDAQRQGSML